MNMEPIITISYELIFQILNTIIILGILVFIIFQIYKFVSRDNKREKYENKGLERKDQIREVNPLDTKRGDSWQLYKDAPMPMVTIFKTLDISNLIKLKSQGYKLNMLVCYCIGLAAKDTPEFALLPLGGKMIKYHKIGVSVIVANEKGGINSCDIPFSADLREFNKSYLELTQKVYQRCQNYEIEDCMMIGTSSLVKYDIDGAVNMYSGIFNNPFIIWGKYTQEEDITKLKISFQFHHVQMDGMQACEFLEKIQKIIDMISIN